MKKDILIQQVKQYIENKSYINIILKKNMSDVLYCIPIAISDKLLMVLEFFDFLPNGYTIIKLKDIKKILYDDACEYFECIVKKEGACDIIEKVPKISIENWKATLLSLKENDLIIIVDIGKEDCVNVGKVVKATNQNVSMLCLSPTGIWDETEWKESSGNLTSVRFLNHYTNTYTKYSTGGA